MITVLLARQMLTPLERVDDAVLVIEDGIISAAGTRAEMSIPAGARIIDFSDAILTPGLVDIHIHGAAGHDVMEGDADSLAAIERLLARHGVTSYCPTTVTAPLNETLAALEKLARAVESAKTITHADRAQPLGIHLEGPFLSHARPGVHPPVSLQPASERVFAPMWEAAVGQVAILTIAPELGGALALIAEAAQRGVCVSIGHTNADSDEAKAGIKAGARHVTHAFNAMRRMEHRDPGVLGVVLTDDSITADIIVDGLHVEPEVVDLFLRTKGLDRAVLISDALSATGMPDGTYRLGMFEVQVRDGRCESHGKLAGSVLTLDQAIGNVMRFARLSFQDGLRLATLNPARVLGIENRKGVLKPGADADIAVFTPEGTVRQTIVRGMVG
ncbi:MAG TPA: N-acetylglucosamine-6-phosphate deacetylase [Verrucomicrobiae bacterium]|nr:N-acetylglucosamine-6-phosphate deacetylase [Verrucomicrobiae bacterium]